MPGTEFIDAAASAVIPALLNGLWQGLVLVAGVALVLRVLGARSGLNATTRYAVWCITLLAVAALPLLAGLGSLRPADEAPVPIHVSSTHAPASAVEGGPAAVVEPSVGDGRLSVTGSEEAFAAFQQPLVVPGRSRWSLPPGWWVYGAALAWLVGVVVLAIRLVRGYGAVRALKRSGRSLPLGLQRRLDAWLPTMTRRTVRVAVVEGPATPVAAGYRSPMILLPAPLLHTLTDEECEQVVLHELAHLARGDDWTHLFQKIVETLFFFHPAVHWVGRQMNRERELACDDWVVNHTRQPKSYASCLVRLVELNLRGRLVAAPGMAVRKGQLVARVRRLTDPDRQPSVALSRLGILAAVGALAVTFWVLTMSAPVIGLSERSPASPTDTVIEPVAPAVPVAPVLHARRVEEAAEPVAPANETVETAESEPVPAGAPPEPMQPEAVAPLDVAAPEALSSDEPMAVLPRPSAGDEVTATASPDPDLSVASWVKVLRAARGMASGGDRSRFLVEAVPRMPEHPDVHAAYLETTRSIPSSSDRQRTLAALLAAHRLDATALVRLFDVVKGIPSSGSKAAVLIRVAEVLPDDNGVRDAFLEVAGTISSRSDYQRVMAALLGADR